MKLAGVWAFVLHADSFSTIPGIPYGSQSQPRVIPESQSLSITEYGPNYPVHTPQPCKDETVKSHPKKSLNQPDYSYTLFWRMVFLELSACLKDILTGQKTLFLCIISFSFYPPSTLGIEPGLISHVCKTCACYGTTSLNPPLLVPSQDGNLRDRVER